MLTKSPGTAAARCRFWLRSEQTSAGRVSPKASQRGFLKKKLCAQAVTSCVLIKRSCGCKSARLLATLRHHWSTYAVFQIVGGRWHLANINSVKCGRAQREKPADRRITLKLLPLICFTPFRNYIYYYQMVICLEIRLQELGLS